MAELAIRVQVWQKISHRLIQIVFTVPGGYFLLLDHNIVFKRIIHATLERPEVLL
jgi:hypothetical protein